MTTVTLEKQGEAIGITIPDETRIRMGFEVGQNLTLVELPDGLKLVRGDSQLERQLQVARRVLREQADVLRELAKR
jgi:bifunctional DNA-binding transcriptional regulator/antitoxin component of YhaV-PrlF toxin-antitoxin module